MKLWLFLISLFSAVNVFSQFSPVDFIQCMPISVSPSLTGAFDGKVRTSLLHRQMRYISVSGRSANHDKIISIEANINTGLSEGDKISISANYIKTTLREFDISGIGNIESDYFLNGQHRGLSFSYHFKFGENSKRVLSLGVSIAKFTSEFDSKVYIPADIKNANTLAIVFTPKRLDLSESHPYSNIFLHKYSLGLMWSSPSNETSDVRVGVSIGKHPFQNAKATYNGFINYSLSISKRISWNLNSVASYYDQNTFLFLQSLFHLSLNKSGTLLISGGVGVRRVNYNEYIAYLGFSFRGWRLSFSDRSDFSAVHSFQKKEIGLTKVLKWGKDKDIKESFPNWHRKP